jgi:hypothetical protein
LAGAPERRENLERVSLFAVMTLPGSNNNVPPSVGKFTSSCSNILEIRASHACRAGSPLTGHLRGMYKHRRRLPAAQAARRAAWSASRKSLRNHRMTLLIALPGGI